MRYSVLLRGRGDYVDLFLKHRKPKRLRGDLSWDILGVVIFSQFALLPLGVLALWIFAPLSLEEKIGTLLPTAFALAFLGAPMLDARNDRTMSQLRFRPADSPTEVRIFMPLRRERLRITELRRIVIVKYSYGIGVEVHTANRWLQSNSGSWATAPALAEDLGSLLASTNVQIEIRDAPGRT